MIFSGGFQARRALRALRGLVRLKTLIQGNNVKRQATSTLKCMQTLARVQSQVYARRIRMSEENEALQRQLQQKHEKELEKLKASVSSLYTSLYTAAFFFFFTWMNVCRQLICLHTRTCVILYFSLHILVSLYKI